MSKKTKILQSKKRAKHEFSFYFEGLTPAIKHVSAGAILSVSDEHVARGATTGPADIRTASLFEAG